MGGVPPRTPSQQPQNDNPAPSPNYEAVLMNPTLATPPAGLSTLIYSTKRRWSGIDVAVASSNQAPNQIGFVVQVFAVMAGLRVLVAEGTYGAAQYGNQDRNVRIASVRNVLCDSFDVVAVASGPNVPLRLTFGIVASDQTNAVDVSDNVGTFSTTGGQLADMSTHQVIPSGAQLLSGLAAVTAAGANSTWLQVFENQTIWAGVVPNGTAPSFSTLIPVGGGVNLHAALRGRRWGTDSTGIRAGAIVGASSTPGTMTAVGAGVAFGTVIYR